MDKKKGLYLVLGIVATVAFGVFSSHIYELMFYDNNYSNAMYNYGVYGSMAMITIAIAWGAAALLTVFCGVRMRLMVAILILTGYWAVCVFLSAPDRPGALPLSMEGCFSGWVDRMLMPGKLTVPGVITY